MKVVPEPPPVQYSKTVGDHIAIVRRTVQERSTARNLGIPGSDRPRELREQREQAAK